MDDIPCPASGSWTRWVPPVVMNPRVPPVGLGHAAGSANGHEPYCPASRSWTIVAGRPLDDTGALGSLAPGRFPPEKGEYVFWVSREVPDPLAFTWPPLAGDIYQDN